jgi:LysM repeat protein
MPQGALEEQRPRNKSNVYIAVFAILAFHVVLLGALLLQGCKDNRSGANLANNNEAGLVLPSNPPPADLGMANPFAPPPDLASNPVASGNTPPPLANPPGATLPPVPGPAVVTPPPTAPAATAATTGAREHEVQPGENFTTIGKKYNVSPTAIAKANPGVDSRRLRVGQKIKIPEAAATVAATPETRAPAASGSAAALPAPAGAVTYEVKPGDTLIKIARSQKSSVEKIKAANNLKTTMIRPGQKLVIPARQEAAPASPATPVVPPTSTGYVTPLPGNTTASL